jgi:hypothetical protein
MRTLLLAASCLLLASCATEYKVPAAVAGPLDSSARAAGLSPRKIKFTGPVTLQVGGSHNTATALEKPNGPLATAPHATATDASKKGGLPWWVFVGVGAVSIAAWEWLTKNFTPMGWLPWRTK